MNGGKKETDIPFYFDIIYFVSDAKKMPGQGESSVHNIVFMMVMVHCIIFSTQFCFAYK